MDVDLVHELATSLARGGGELARRASGTGEGMELVDHIPEVVHDIERRIVHGVMARFEDHAVVGRVTAGAGPADAVAMWSVNPLDGIGNFQIGLDVYGVSIVVTDGRSCVAAFHDAAIGRTWHGGTGIGAFRDGKPVTVTGPDQLDSAVVGVTPRTLSAREIELLDSQCGRVIQIGTHGHLWGLLASGGIHAVVGSLDDPETAGGTALAVEAGGRAIEASEHMIAGHGPTVDALAAILDGFI